MCDFCKKMYSDEHFPEANLSRNLKNILRSFELRFIETDNEALLTSPTSFTEFVNVICYCLKQLNRFQNVSQSDQPLAPQKTRWVLLAFTKKYLLHLLLRVIAVYEN